MEFLQRTSWPGNVRELENVVRKSLLLAQSYTINVDHVRAALNKDRRPWPVPPPAPSASTWTICWPPPGAAK